MSVCVPKLAFRMFIRDKIDTAYPTGDADHMICGNFAINASFKSDGVICLPTASYSGSLHNFLVAEHFKALKK